MEMTLGKTESNSKEQDVTYESFELNSFSEIVKEVLDSKDSSSFCFVDWDQTVTGGGLENIRNPEISLEVKDSLRDLLGGFPVGNVCITTDRAGIAPSVLENVVFNTKEVLDALAEFLEESDYPGTVPIFLALKKQLPGLMSNQREDLVKHVVEQIVSKNIQGNMKIFMIENFSSLGLSRRKFLEKVGKEVKEKLNREYDRDLGIDIKDYILKH